MWTAWLWLSLAQACPKVYCGNSRSDVCLTWSAAFSEAVLHPCSDSNSQCPADLFAKREDLSCVETPGYELDLWNPYYGRVGRWTEFPWKHEGNFCDQISDICRPGLYCDSNQICRLGKNKGELCMQGECALGLTCNLGLCIAVGSVSVGVQVSAPFACEFFLASTELVCLLPEKSRKPIPIACSSDQDCEGEDGSPGQCQCAYNEAGAAYCALHPGDSEYQRYLKAQAELDYKVLPRAFYTAKYYPLLVQPNACSSHSIPEVFMYSAYSAAALLWTGGVLLSL